jgi:hypothetical protein
VPSTAYGLVVLFTVVAVLCGVAAASLVGPRTWRAALIPSAMAFLALYLVGHRSGLQLGPTLELFGFSVAIVQDLVAAFLAAVLAATAQRLVLDRRRARGRAPGQVH